MYQRRMDEFHSYTDSIHTHIIQLPGSALALGRFFYCLWLSLASTCIDHQSVTSSSFSPTRPDTGGLVRTTISDQDCLSARAGNKFFFFWKKSSRTLEPHQPTLWFWDHNPSSNTIVAWLKTRKNPNQDTLYTQAIDAVPSSNASPPPDRTFVRCHVITWKCRVEIYTTRNMQASPFLPTLHE